MSTRLQIPKAQQTPLLLCHQGAAVQDVYKRQFLPFGGGEPELPDPGEVVYVSGGEVRTRRWTWRQSETGKITPETRSVLYPVDGFLDHNREEVLAARDELARCV